MLVKFGTIRLNYEGGEFMEKKEYKKPELVVYEDLKSLTAGVPPSEDPA